MASWNKNRNPLGLIEAAIVGLLGLSSIAAIGLWTCDRKLDCADDRLFRAIGEVYGLVGLAGLLATFASVEFNRLVFSSAWFRQYSGRSELDQEGKQLRMSPRLEPIATGVIERLLFTSAAIVLLHYDQHTALAAICAGYVGLKGIKRGRAQEKAMTVSIHSIWGSSVSLAFAVFAGWLFNDIYR